MRSQRMPGRIYMICNSYESGFGHGVKNDGLDLSKTPHGDPELGEAYQIGYEAGFEQFIVASDTILNGGKSNV
jgi:hypothetical protein